MQQLGRNIFIAAVAAFLSAVLTGLIPLVNATLNGKGLAKQQLRIVAQVEMKKLDAPKPTEAHRKLKQPARAKPLQAPVKAGPRFAMDLDVGGLAGAAVPLDIVNRPSGG